MGFKCGIVGLPNVGKSTLYNTLTGSRTAAENYPFCTIDPSIGKVAVPDPRLHKIASLIQPQRLVPTTMTFVDIAGLVAGASKGEGLGNRFLGNIRETQAIVHVVRCFDNDDVVHVNSKISAIDDVAIIDTELLLSDLEQFERNFKKNAAPVKSSDSRAKAKQQLYERAVACLAAGEPLRSLTLTADEHQQLQALQPLTLKPVLYVANVEEQSAHSHSQVNELRTLAAKQNAMVVVISAVIEAEIAALAADEQREFLASLGLHQSGLERLIQSGYALLQLLTFFTAGPQEVRAWTTSDGTSARDAAGSIHTDFAKKFIRAEVIAYDDFIAYGSEQRAKAAGKWRLEGRDYRVLEGDIIHFRHGA